MGKDITEKRLEEFDDVFIDIFDNVLFEGIPVLAKEKLEQLPTESFVKQADRKWHQWNRDIRKGSRTGGRYRLICGIENQSGIDYTMPERVMGLDYASYEAQIREIIRQNKEADNPAYTKRIHENQKLAPVVTVVLNYGEEKWESPVSIHDMLDFPGENEHTLKQYVSDYRINVINVANLPEETRKRLQSDFRFIAEYLACNGDAEKFLDSIKSEKRSIRHPEELGDVMEELSGKKRLIKEVIEGIQKEEKEEMADGRIIDGLIEIGRKEGRNKGREEGREEGRKEGRKEGREEGKAEGREEERKQGIRTFIRGIRDLGIPDAAIVDKLKDYYHLDEENARVHLAAVNDEAGKYSIEKN